MKKPKDQSDPVRPLCMCGSPGAFLVQIEVQELVLDREAGIASRPYWSPKYRSGTRIESIMCPACVRANVQLQVSAVAKFEKGQEQ
jgi:hypothetical protein